MSPTTTNVPGYGKVLWHTSMSLDGFVAGPDHAMEWMSLDWLPKRESGLPAQARQVADATGAILAGRRWHDALDGLGGSTVSTAGAWSGPVFVLTSRPDASLAHKGVTFVSDGIEAAVSAALAAAEARNLACSARPLPLSASRLGCLTQVIVAVAPVLLGDGIRLFGGPGGKQRKLEPVAVSSMGDFANLHYRVVK
jgi:dihydrofolate reductase